MSAQDEFALVQRIVSVLFQRGHMMTRFTIEYFLRELTQHIERMINLNDTTERNHLDQQVLLIQQLNEVNERMRMQEHTQYINQSQFEFINGQNINGQNINGQDINGEQDINIDMDVDEDEQSELDQSFIVQPFTFNPEPFTVNPPIYRRLFVPPVRNNPIERSKVIARRKLEEPCPTECSVCQEVPKYKDAVCTECNHYYCKGCWENWMNAEGSNKKCPTCRKDMPRITTFKGRAPNRRNVV
jgi:hypothetical protein